MFAHLAITAAVLAPGVLVWWVTKNEAPAASSAKQWGVTQLDPDLDPA
jgi:hypothetical protein